VFYGRPPSVSKRDIRSPPDPVCVLLITVTGLLISTQISSLERVQNGRLALRGPVADQVRTENLSCMISKRVGLVKNLRHDAAGGARPFLSELERWESLRRGVPGPSTGCCGKICARLDLLRRAGSRPSSRRRHSPFAIFFGFPVESLLVGRAHPKHDNFSSLLRALAALWGMDPRDSGADDDKRIRHPDASLTLPFLTVIAPTTPGWAHSARLQPLPEPRSSLSRIVRLGSSDRCRPSGTHAAKLGNI